MTFRTFLRRLAKTEGWYLTNGWIRLKITSGPFKHGCHCPLSAVAAQIYPSVQPCDGEYAGVVLDIPVGKMQSILDAADYFNLHIPAVKRIRASLLKACHLKERK